MWEGKLNFANLFSYVVYFYDHFGAEEHTKAGENILFGGFQTFFSFLNFTHFFIGREDKSCSKGFFVII